LTLFVAFKGTGNSSHQLVSGLNGDKLFLTNSFSGLKRDIDNVQGNFRVVFFHIPSIRYINEDFVNGFKAVL